MKTSSKALLTVFAFVLYFVCAVGLIFWLINFSLNQIPDNELWRITSLGQTSFLTLVNNKVIFESKNSQEWDCLCVYAADKATGEILWSTEELAKPYIDEYEKLYPKSIRVPGLVEFVGNDSESKIVFVTVNFFLYALHEDNGHVLWGPMGISSYLFSDAPNSSVIFVISDAGDLIALEKTSGKELWNVQTVKTSPDFYSRMFLHDGMVYADIDNGDKNSLLAFDSQNGQLHWKIEQEPRAYFPIFDADNLYMIQHSDFDNKDGEIFVIDTKTGQKRWNEVFPGDYSFEPSHPQVEGDRIYVIQEGKSGDKRVSKLVVRNTQSGEVLWEFNRDYSEGKVIYYVYDDFVYVGSEIGNIFALNAKNGQELWKVETQSFPTCMTISNDLLFVDAEDTYIAAFEPKTGIRQWIQPIPVNSNRYFSECFGSEGGVRIYSNKMFVVDSHRKLYALDLITGHELWSWQDFRFPDWRPIPIYKPTPEIAVIEDNIIYVFNSQTIAEGVFALKIQ